MTRGAGMLLALALLTTAPEAGAQVTTLRGLAFGTVTSGTTTQVLKTSVSAGQWRITGIFLLGGTFTLTLPTTLAGPGTPMPITFSGTDGQRNTTNNPSGGSSFNPHGSQSIPVLTLGGTIYVWLGGSVAPPLNQAPGDYSATVVLTVAGML